MLARSLAAPKQILRTVEAELSTPLSAKELKPGTLVMMQLDKAMPRAPDAEMIFMRDHWNGCPAQAFVTALLQAVWHHSLRCPSASTTQDLHTESVS